MSSAFRPRFERWLVRFPRVVKIPGCFFTTDTVTVWVICPLCEICTSAVSPCPNTLEGHDRIYLVGLGEQQGSRNPIEEH